MTKERKFKKKQNKRSNPLSRICSKSGASNVVPGICWCWPHHSLYSLFVSSLCRHPRIVAPTPTLLLVVLHIVVSHPHIVICRPSLLFVTTLSVLSLFIAPPVICQPLPVHCRSSSQWAVLMWCQLSSAPPLPPMSSGAV